MFGSLACSIKISAYSTTDTIFFLFSLAIFFLIVTSSPTIAKQICL